MRLRNIIMLSIVIISLIVTVILFAFLDKNDYVFKVDGEKVSIAEFNSYLEIQKKLMEGDTGEKIVWSELQDGVPMIDKAKEEAKTYLIDNKIKSREALKRKVTISTDEEEKIKNQITALMEKNLEGVYNLTKEEMIKIIKDATLEKKLAIAIYKETDHTGHTHGTFDVGEYESGADMQSESYSPRHILFDTQGKTQEEKEAIKVKAQQVLNRIKNGEDFPTLAKEFSDDGGSKANGGLYEGITKGEFIPEFEKAALSLQVGEVYPDLVEGKFGYHIIKLEGHMVGGLSKEEATAIISQEFFQKFQEWKNAAVIEVGKQYYEIGIKTENE